MIFYGEVPDWFSEEGFRAMCGKLGYGYEDELHSKGPGMFPSDFLAASKSASAFYYFKEHYTPAATCIILRDIFNLF